MNQILYVEEPNTSADINSVVKFFCVVAIIFGTILVGQGSYAVFKNISNYKPDIPVVEAKAPEATAEKQNDMVVISVVHDKAIDKIRYKWNNGVINEIDGNERTRFSEEIELPLGENTLFVTVLDIDGIKTEFEKQFTYIDETIVGGNVVDNIKPTIDLTTQGSNVRILVRDETKLQYMTYRWNNEEEIRIDAREGENVIEKIISIIAGSNDLTVTAVDASGNKETITKTYVTAVRPKITVTQEGKFIIIKATHDNKVTGLKYNLNGQDYEMKFTKEHKEIEWKQELISGENKIKVIAYTVYNVDGQDTEVTEEFNGTFNY